jgi:hypothetical protein
MVVPEAAVANDAASLLANVLTGDVAIGVEAGSVAAAISSGDTGSAVEFVQALSRAVGDTASGVEATSITAVLSAGDVAGSVDGATLLASVLVADYSVGMDFVAAFSRTIRDTALGVDSVFHVAVDSVPAPTFTITWKQQSLTTSYVVKVVTAPVVPTKWLTSDGSITIL